MKSSVKNCLLQNKALLISLFWLTCLPLSKSQIGNYVSNGSFEDYYVCNGIYYPISNSKNWLSIDSTSYAGDFSGVCNFRVPGNASGFQYPHFGNVYTRVTMYCLLQGCGRGYPKNRLKATLKPGVSYCVKFHISIADESPRGIDGFGAYFGDNTIDTITYCNVPLSYLDPQVKNPLGNVITDTLNWTAITGTFTANGTEKYLLLGNFLADNAVTTASINTPSFPQYWTDVYVDDVSCIAVDLPAYAGPDKVIEPGDSAFIGREPDFATDPGCTWFRLPDMSPVATISGLWVKPPVTATYVVRQILECSPEKWDTVVVFVNPVGLTKLQALNDNWQIVPNPAQEQIKIHMAGKQLFDRFRRLQIYNNLGQLIREEEINPEREIFLDVRGLDNGVYLIIITDSEHEKFSKKLLIAK
jgi:hypothetical protein